MNRLRLSIAALAFGLITAGTAVSLDATDVIQLLRNNVPESIIINIIRESKLSEPPTADEILAISQNGGTTALMQLLTSPEAYGGVPGQSAYAGSPAGMVVRSECLSGDCPPEEIFDLTTGGGVQYVTPQSDGTAYYDTSDGYTDAGGYYITPGIPSPSTYYYYDDYSYPTYDYYNYYDYSYPSYSWGGSYFRPPSRPNHRPPSRPDHRPPSRPDHRPPSRPEPGRPSRPGGDRPSRPESGSRPERPRPPSGGGNRPPPPPQGEKPNRPPRRSSIEESRPNRRENARPPQRNQPRSGERRQSEGNARSKR